MNYMVLVKTLRLVKNRFIYKVKVGIVMQVKACEECGCDKIEHDAMRIVTGQQNGPEAEVIVATCIDCGWKWRVEQE